MKLIKIGKVVRLYSGEYVSVDEEDFERINKHKWGLFKSEKWKYAIRTENENEKQKTIFMHREIMEITDPKVYIDHKDHNGLNNHKDNLRKSNNQLNQYNVGEKANSRQKYKNIRKVGKNSWEIRIRTPEGRIHKRVHSEEEAVKTYNGLAIKYHGEFAYIQEYIK